MFFNVLGAHIFCGRILLCAGTSCVNSLSDWQLVLSALSKVHSSKGGQDRELSWRHNVAVGIVSRTASRRTRVRWRGARPISPSPSPNEPSGNDRRHCPLPALIPRPPSGRRCCRLSSAFLRAASCLAFLISNASGVGCPGVAKHFTRYCCLRINTSKQGVK